MITDWSEASIEIKALHVKRAEKLNLRDYDAAKFLCHEIDDCEVELRNWIKEKRK